MSSMKPVCNLVLLVFCIGRAAGQDDGKEIPLNATEGKDFVLPHNLTVSGTLSLNTTRLLTVVDGEISYISAEKVMWNKSTGEMKLINLQKGSWSLKLHYQQDSDSIAYNLTVRATTTPTPPVTPTPTTTPPTTTPPTTPPTTTPPTTPPTTTPTPTENNPSWWISLLVVLGLVLVFAVLEFRFGFCKKVTGFIRSRRNRRSAADLTPTQNGNVEDLPMMPPGDGTAETSV